MRRGTKARRRGLAERPDFERRHQVSPITLTALFAVAQVAVRHGRCEQFGGRRGRIGVAWRLTLDMREENASPDSVVAEIAARQHGVVAVEQLLGARINKDGILRRVKAGRLFRVHRGIYSVGHSALSREGRWLAAVLACGRVDPLRGTRQTMPVLEYWGAALSHRSAAELWGLLRPRDGPVDVSIRGDGGKAKRSGIRLHRSHLLLPAAVTSRTGIPATTPVKTIADLRRVSRGKRQLITPRELRRAVRQANVFGLPIEEGDRRRRERSDLEEDFVALCRRHRLPLPEVNVRIGEHLVDFLWRERMVVVETDGYIYHRGRAAFEDDRSTGLSLRAMGYEVVRIADTQIDEEPEQVADAVGAALRVGADAA